MDLEVLHRGVEARPVERGHTRASAEVEQCEADDGSTVHRGEVAADVDGPGCRPGGTVSTLPFTTGANWVMAPVVASKAKTRLRVIVVELLAGLTDVNEPATTIVFPTWVIDRIWPLLTPGVNAAGTADGISMAGAASTGATASVVPPGECQGRRHRAAP